MRIIPTGLYRFAALSLALLGFAEFGASPVRAATCYVSSRSLVCDCTNCSYVVICGVRLGFPPFVDMNICNGNNPGFLAPSYDAGPSGLTSTKCTFSPDCRTATATGTCCGGARTAFTDWSGYITCVPSGNDCAPGGTGTGQ